MPPDSTAPPLDLSVVVVTYQSDHLIGPCLERLLDAGLDASALLVVDNDSSDDTVAVARARGATVVETGRNAGFGAACNAGLARARTELVAFANPDIAIGREDLVRLVAALRADPAAAAAGPLLGHGPPSVRRFSTIASDLAGFVPRALRRLVRRRVRDIPLRPAELGAPVAVDYAEGAFLVCRAEAVRAVGGFDERFFLYSEEEDLCRRLATAGWRTLVVPAARADHVRTTSSKGASPSTLARHRMRSRYLFYRKHRSRVYAEAARAALGVALVLDRGLRTALRRPQAYAPGTLRALLAAHRPEARGG